MRTMTAEQRAAHRARNTWSRRQAMSAAKADREAEATAIQLQQVHEPLPPIVAERWLLENMR